MSTLLPRNQNHGSQGDGFNRLLAQYRAKVFEHCYLRYGQQEFSMEEVVHNKLDKPSILVIEDNPDDWFLTRYGLLRQFPEAQCHWLAEEAGVLDYLDQWTMSEKELPRLILVAQNGMRVIKILKAHGLYKTIPMVVMLSRSADLADMARVLPYQVNDYIIKPTDPKVWLTVFQELAPYWQPAKCRTV